MLRAGERIVHLSKTVPKLRFYDLTGALERQVDLDGLSAHSMTADPKGFWVLEANARTEGLEHVLYAPDGTRLDARPPWLQVEPENARYAASFSFFEESSRWDLPVFFPQIHRQPRQASDSSNASWLPRCTYQLSHATLAAWRDQVRKFGLPEPIGDGFLEPPHLDPVLLAATRNESEILALLNGGALATLDLETKEIQCRRISPPPAAAGWVPTSIAAHEDTIVILDRTAEGVGVRMLRKHPASTDPMEEPKGETR